MARDKGAHGKPVDVPSEPHGAVAALLKAAPFLQPYIVMMRAVILKIYLITVVMVNTIVVMVVPVALVKKLTGNTKTSSKSRALGNKALDDEAETDAINLRVRIMDARNLPQMDKGSCDCYVRVKLAGKEFQTKPVMESLNPEFSSEFKFETRKDSKGTLILELWDYDVPGDDFIGLVKVSVPTVVAQRKLEKSFEVFDRSGIPVKNTTTRKPTKLRVCLSYDTEGSQGESEWLNGILRKGWRCLGQDIDAKVKEAVTKVLATIPVKIPVVGPFLELQLDHFSIGTEAPYLNELRILPTRSAKDVQLRANLRWVTSGEFGIKVSAGARFLNKLGLRISISVSDIEIDFPVWVQAHLNDNLTAAVKKFQIAATAEPRVRVALSIGFFSTRSVPGLPEMIEVAIRNVLKKKLVLPQKISSLIGPGPEKPIKYSELERAGVARVSIKVLEACNITEVQGIAGTLDPFVVVTMMGSPTEKNGLPKYGMPQIYTTKNVIAKNSACEWNEFLHFIVTDEEKESIQFQLMDKGVMSDEPCGKLVLPMAELAQAARAGSSLTEEWYNLADSKTGRIRLSVEYAPFVPDDGPTETDDQAFEKALQRSKQASEPVASDMYGSLCLQIIKAAGIPKTLMGGKPNAYVTVSYASYAGSSILRTSAPESDCNPEWNEDMVFREKIPKDNAKVEDKDIVVTLNDSSSSSLLDGDPFLASATLKLKQVLAKPGDFEVQMKDKSGADVCPVVLRASFEPTECYSESVAAIGSDWLNGVLRKGWSVFSGEVDKKVREEVGIALHKISYPAPDPDTGQVKSLPGIKELVLEDFSIGKEPPFFLELKLLNTQSPKDVQLLSRLRWVCGEGMIIKIRAKGNTGIPDVTIEITNLEIYFPAWIQIRMAGFGTGLTADTFELAATELPDIKIRINITAGMLPTGLSPATIDNLVKNAIKNVLVLPKKIQVCLAKDSTDVTGKIKMAGNLVGKGYPKDSATGRLLVATDNSNTPLYASIDAFKEERLKRNLTDLEARAVGRVNLKIIEALGLPDPEGWGMVNACAEACIVGSGQERKTSTRLSTCPAFNEFMDFLVVDEKTDTLLITIRDIDLLHTAYSIELGTLEIKVADLLSKTGWREAILPLQNPQIPDCGQLRIAVEYAPMAPLTGPLPPDQFAKTKPVLEEEKEEESPFTGKVIVTVEKAENLIKLDWTGGGLDPYVTIDMGSHSKKTPTNSGLNPVWDKTFAFDCEGCGSTTLSVAVKDAEKMQADRMVGIVTLKLEDLVLMPGKVMKEGFVLRNPEDRQVVKDANGNKSTLYLTVKYVDDADSTASTSTNLLPPQVLTPQPGPKALEEPAAPPQVLSRGLELPEGSAAESGVASEAAGSRLPVFSSLTSGERTGLGIPPLAIPTSTKGSLFVRVIKGNDLQKMDFSGSSDPYVSLTLNGQGKDKTRVMNSSLDPEWNEDFHFQVDLVNGGKCEQVLMLNIKDDDMGMNQFMGKVEIPVQQVIDVVSRRAAVYEILDKQGKQVIGKSGKGATLTLDLEYKLM